MSAAGWPAAALAPRPLHLVPEQTGCWHWLVALCHLRRPPLPLPPPAGRAAVRSLAMLRPKPPRGCPAVLALAASPAAASLAASRLHCRHLGLWDGAAMPPSVGTRQQRRRQWAARPGRLAAARLRDGGGLPAFWAAGGTCKGAAALHWRSCWPQELLLPPAVGRRRGPSALPFSGRCDGDVVSAINMPDGQEPPHRAAQHVVCGMGRATAA